MWRLQAAHFGGNSPAMRYRVHSAQHRYCHAMGMIEIIPWLPSRPTRGDAFTGVGHGDIIVVVDVDVDVCVEVLVHVVSRLDGTLNRGAVILCCFV